MQQSYNVVISEVIDDRQKMYVEILHSYQLFYIFIVVISCYDATCFGSIIPYIPILFIDANNNKIKFNFELYFTHTPDTPAIFEYSAEKQCMKQRLFLMCSHTKVIYKYNEQYQYSSIFSIAYLFAASKAAVYAFSSLYKNKTDKFCMAVCVPIGI